MCADSAWMGYLFSSQQLKPHEWNDLTNDLELATIIPTLKIQRRYLLSQEVYIDHQRLKHISTWKELNMIYRLSLELVANYDLDVKYYSGRITTTQDTLS